MTRGQLNYGSEKHRVGRRYLQKKDLAGISSNTSFPKTPEEIIFKDITEYGNSQNLRKIKTIYFNNLKIKENLPRISREAIFSNSIKSTSKEKQKDTHKNALNFRLSKTL